jgi:hypothetical protein
VNDPTLQHRTDKPSRKLRSLITGAAILSSIIILATLTGWVFVIVRGASEIPPSDFVSLPTTVVTTQGTTTMFLNVTTIFQSGLAVGVMGYLLTSTGTPIAGAKVYMTYFYEFAYRTQVTTTNQNGFFEALFPMSWTGWLPLTLTYFGGSQYRGLKKVFNLPGEHL